MLPFWLRIRFQRAGDLAGVVFLLRKFSAAIPLLPAYQSFNQPDNLPLPILYSGRRLTLRTNRKCAVISNGATL